MDRMARFIVYSQADAFVQELSSADVFSAVRTEELNGQNSLELTTSAVLVREQRILACDAMGVWREYVVTGVDEAHEAAQAAIGTYYCEWSLQHDLQQLAVENKRPGLSGTKVPAASALRSLIEGTGSKRWSVGTVTVTSTGGASFYHESAWEALSDLVETWGGEVASDIAVDSQGVISRKVSLLAHRGATEATRRFDFGSDLKQIRRKVSEDPLYCRIIPLGKGEDLDGDGKGYGRRVTISSVNGGRDYLENTEAAKAFRLPDGAGGYDYPTLYVTQESIEEPADLLAWGKEHLDDYTVPKVTYEGSVIQFAEAGMDIKGLALGDEAQCVDRCFHEDAALRVSGRVVKLVVDELDPRNARVTLGYIQEGIGSLIGGMLGGLQTSISGIQESIKGINGGTMSTADYLNRLIDRLNKEMNATGGYTYIKPGEGIWVYDKAEDQNPTQVVRIKGGSISIANKKKPNGDWDWETMITGKDGILATAVTAANITTGFIRSADGSSYWDLDSNTLVTSNASLNGVFASYGDTPTRFYDSDAQKYLYWWPAIVCEDGQIYFRGAISTSSGKRPNSDQYVYSAGSVLGAERSSVTFASPRYLILRAGTEDSDPVLSLTAGAESQGSFSQINANLECERAMVRVNNLSLASLNQLYVSNGQSKSGYGFTGSKNGCEFINGICIG